MISQDEDRQKLIRDVQCLTFDAVLIHNSFSEIDEELSLIAAETLSFFDPHLFFRQHVLQFQTDLRGYHQQYRDLLWKSREVAGEASAMLEDFVQNSVPLIRDEKVDIEEKVLLFKIAIDTIPAHEAAAQHATDAFERLYTDLQSALNVWTKLHAQSIQNLSNRENRMGELLRDLVHRVQSKSLGPARGMMKALHLSHVLAVLCPAYTVHGVDGGVNAGPIEVSMLSVVEKIQFIHGIWLQICAELVDIHQKLKIQASAAYSSLTLFNRRMEKLEPLFENLVHALRAYRVGVASARVMLTLS